VVLNSVQRCPKELKDFEDMENMNVSEVEVAFQDNDIGSDSEASI